MNYKLSLFVSLLLLTSIFLIPDVPKARAHSDKVFEAFATEAPVMDGVINDDEWKDAATVTFSIPEGDATIYVMNDRRNLYFAAKVSDNTLDEIVNVALDIFTIDFDVRHDGELFTIGEDTISIGARNRYGDGFVGPGLDILDDSITNVDGLVGRQGNYNHFEIVHDFNSGDANDLAAEIGDTIGVRFLLFDQSGSDVRTISVYPTNVDPNDDDQSMWADIVIAESPEGDSGSGSGGFPVTEVGIVVVLLGWAGYFGFLVRKRQRS